MCIQMNRIDPTKTFKLISNFPWVIQKYFSALRVKARLLKWPQCSKFAYVLQIRTAVQISALTCRITDESNVLSCRNLRATGITRYTAYAAISRVLACLLHETVSHFSCCPYFFTSLKGRFSFFIPTLCYKKNHVILNTYFIIQ